jgi:two-component system, LytTR family, sensor kinase
VPYTAAVPASALSRWRLSPYWTAQLLGWGAYAVAKYTLAGAIYPSVGRVLLLVAIGLLLSLPLRPVYRHLRERSISQPLMILLAAAASFGLANVWLLLYDGLLHWSGAHPFEGWPAYSKGVLNKTPVLLAWSALYLGIKHQQDLLAERERTLRATALATEAQLEMLRYQLQPHFLFNSLNSLRALIAEDPSRARAMVTELSDFLRYSLLARGATEMPLAEEIASIQRYLTLEQVRYEGGLQVTVEVEPAAESKLIPSFLLHPLAENAVKYSIRSSPRPLRVQVTARVEGPRLLVEIANTGRWCEPHDGPPENGLKVGLANVRQRLAWLYPGRHTFEVGQSDGWVRARIELVNGGGP